MFLSDIVIILSRVSESGNVGAVCRAMKNMGLHRLRLAAPGQLDEKTILSRAIHADDVWKNSQIYDSLALAAGDCSLLVATTRRRGRKRKITIEPEALAEWLVEQYSGRQGETRPIALVFGNERTGLDEEELNLCSIASHIPVSDDFPSLNLSHAVQIYAYELFLACGRHENSTLAAPEPAVKGEWTPMSRVQVDELTGLITNTLENVGFYRNPGREEQTRFLRDLMSRAGLTEREGRYLVKIFAKAARLGNAQCPAP